MDKPRTKSFKKIGMPAGILTLTAARDVVLIQNHHTYIPGYKDFNGKNHLDLLEGMERAHLKRGFGSLAQHFTTFSDGSVWTGRSMDIDPCGIYGQNGGAVCLEHLGNFDEGKDRMADVHAVAIINLNASLCARFSLEPGIDSIVYHHWFDAKTGERTGGKGSVKTCPGTAFFGGNSEEAANLYFLPKIKEALSGIKPVDNPVKNKNRMKGAVKVPPGDSLNVRKGPGIKYPVTGTLEQDTKVEIHEVKNGWYRVSTKQHWVRGKYIEKNEN